MSRKVPFRHIKVNLKASVFSFGIETRGDIVENDIHYFGHEVLTSSLKEYQYYRRNTPHNLQVIVSDKHSLARKN